MTWIFWYGVGFGLLIGIVLGLQIAIYRIKENEK